MAIADAAFTILSSPLDAMTIIGYCNKLAMALTSR
eukprot:CAMPEP_0197838270 /NCGR_PEP_ID=MMETSP1437-20131217/35467_1 /TAXON_ID=49252 ORGANISM="Eucampia antarctica, Strain CCMP1452" /NCGR_SAMPLE_ID=MMETSP1437 /ASSEMBLY_ACC=CAM_ASM_001096 /LENGTH=34 /DNA_ID= /DNA_START= /DNA_END= /DNA_ORIENTATION=